MMEESRKQRINLKVTNIGSNQNEKNNNNKSLKNGTECYRITWKR